MTTHISASVAAQEVPLCLRCLDHHGLCEPCKPSVLPQLARAHWQREVHRGENTHGVRVDPKAEKIRQRKERKKRERFERAMRGERVLVRHSKAAA